mmetsp:Transcript_15346/g.20342  ORF Transcript_15346/g.20342 Transcript_15346/m.20342 type:complete len:97 (-) Transcript_15346:911-1201(-)
MDSFQTSDESRVVSTNFADGYAFLNSSTDRKSQLRRFVEPVINLQLAAADTISVEQLGNNLKFSSPALTLICPVLAQPMIKIFVLYQDLTHDVISS